MAKVITASELNWNGRREHKSGFVTIDNQAYNIVRSWHRTEDAAWREVSRVRNSGVGGKSAPTVYKLEA